MNYPIEISTAKDQPNQVGSLIFTKNTLYNEGKAILKCPQKESMFPWKMIKITPNWALIIDLWTKYFINLKTYEIIKKEEYDGFIWHRIDDSKQIGEKEILIVDGCVWACPYEKRIFEIPSCDEYDLEILQHSPS